MTKSELIKALEKWKDDDIVVCQHEDGGWDNIIEVVHLGNNPLSGPSIVFGGGLPFSDE